LSFRGSTIRPDESMNGQILRQVAEAVVQRDCKAVESFTAKMAERRMDVFQIINEGLIPGMLAASQKFRKSEFFIPELLMASRAVKLGLHVLRPLMREKNKQVVGRVVIGSVKFDLHDIGKNLVIIVLEGNGFDVIDLGVDVSPEKFVRAVEKHDAQILAMSSLLTSTMPWMKTTIQLLRSSSMTGVKILIGGAPVTQVYAQNIGADGYCREATSAPAIAKDLLGIKGLQSGNESR